MKWLLAGLALVVVKQGTGRWFVKLLMLLLVLLVILVVGGCSALITASDHGRL